MYDLSSSVNAWKSEMESLRSAQTILRSQRYKFPSEWLDFENVEGEWDALQQLLKSRTRQMESQRVPLQQRILDEEKVLSSNVRDILSEWKDARDTNLMGADVA